MSLAIGVRRERFLPFASDRSGLAARLVHAVAGGAEIAIDVERHLVELGALDWEEVSLTFELELTSELLARVFPEPERHTAPGALWIAVRCDETRLREGALVAPPPLAAGRYELTVTVRAERVFGAVELAPYLVRASDRARAADGFASSRGARLASGRGWELRTEPAKPPSGKHLDVRYASFSEERALARHAGDVYHLEVEAELPILWLNRDHEAVAAVLDDKGTTGRRARLREVAFDLVSGPVWTQLFFAAASHVDEEGASRHEWEESVLRELLPRVVPARDHKSRVLELSRMLREGEHVALLSRLDHALQRRLDLARHLEALIREVLG